MLPLSLVKYIAVVQLQQRYFNSFIVKLSYSRVTLSLLRCVLA
jgi:hypothetical protein